MVPPWFAALAPHLTLDFESREEELTRERLLARSDLSLDGLIDNATLEAFRRLPQLRELYLCDCEFVDPTLVAFPLLRSLRELWLMSTNIGDDALPNLAGLRGIRKLALAYTKVSDEGMGT